MYLKGMRSKLALASMLSLIAIGNAAAQAVDAREEACEDSACARRVMSVAGAGSSSSSTSTTVSAYGGSPATVIQTPATPVAPSCEPSSVNNAPVACPSGFSGSMFNTTNTTCPAGAYGPMSVVTSAYDMYGCVPVAVTPTIPTPVIPTPPTVPQCPSIYSLTVDRVSNGACYYPMQPGYTYQNVILPKTPASEKVGCQIQRPVGSPIGVAYWYECPSRW